MGLIKLFINSGMFVILTAIVMQCDASPLKVCIPDESVDPIFFIEHDGTSQMIVRTAIQSLGQSVEFIPVPQRRCNAGIKSGIYDAALPRAALSDFFPFLIFPIDNQHIDKNYSVLQVSMLAVRRIGSPVNWNGSIFLNTDKPILLKFGVNVVKNKLITLGMPIDEGPDQTSAIRKLINNRGDIAIISSEKAKELVNQVEFRGKVEILPIPFEVAPLFLAFSKVYYGISRSNADAIWLKIRQLNSSDLIKKIKSNGD